MTNRERYKQAFSALHSSGHFSLEVEDMEQIQKRHRKNMAAVAAIACAVVIGTGGTVYAADIGGIQQKISMWLHGEQTQVDVTENNPSGHGGYTFTYTRDGETNSVCGGGVSIDEDGNETWLSAAEVAEGMSRSVDIDVTEDRKIWIYYYDQKVEITDSFDENGLCNLTLTHEDETIHLEITKDEDGGYSFTQTTIPSTDDGKSFRETGGEIVPGKDAAVSDGDTTATTYSSICDGNNE